MNIRHTFPIGQSMASYSSMSLGSSSAHILPWVLDRSTIERLLLLHLAPYDVRIEEVGKNPHIILGGVRVLDLLHLALLTLFDVKALFLQTPPLLVWLCLHIKPVLLKVGYCLPPVGALVAKLNKVNLFLRLYTVW